ncbi:unannotated protein [freshwater metagenome]|uniref:Unannotated protein n=1 Tax=freshwater metagenome TaxID=449393 RepID=A0A6J6C9L9_9ZZZZ
MAKDVDLGLKVGIETATGDIGLRNNVLNRGVRETMLVKSNTRRRQDILTRARGFACWRSLHGCAPLC